MARMTISAQPTMMGSGPASSARLDGVCYRINEVVLHALRQTDKWFRQPDSQTDIQIDCRLSTRRIEPRRVLACNKQAFFLGLNRSRLLSDRQMTVGDVVFSAGLRGGLRVRSVAGERHGRAERRLLHRARAAHVRGGAARARGVERVLPRRATVRRRAARPVLLPSRAAAGLHHHRRHRGHVRGALPARPRLARAAHGRLPSRAARRGVPDRPGRPQLRHAARSAGLGQLQAAPLARVSLAGCQRGRQAEAAPDAHADCARSDVDTDGGTKLGALDGSQRVSECSAVDGSFHPHAYFARSDVDTDGGTKLGALTVAVDGSQCSAQRSSHQHSHFSPQQYAVRLAQRVSVCRPFPQPIWISLRRPQRISHRRSYFSALGGS